MSAPEPRRVVERRYRVVDAVGERVVPAPSLASAASRAPPRRGRVVGVVRVGSDGSEVGRTSFFVQRTDRGPLYPVTASAAALESCL